MWFVSDQRFAVYVQFHLGRAVFIAVQDERIEHDVSASTKVCVEQPLAVFAGVQKDHDVLSLVWLVVDADCIP